MTPANVVAAAKLLGVSLWVADGKLRYRAPPGALSEELASVLRAHRDALVAFLAQQATIPIVDRRLPLVASFAQERLWFLDRLNPGSIAYNMWSVERLRGRLDEAALRRALDELVRRHEALRTTFAEEDGHPVQLIAPPSGMTYAKEDVSGEGDPEGRARALVADEISRPFDLAKGPLVRAVLMRLAESDHVLVFAMHHICGDAWSIDLMWRELSATYATFASGRASPLADLSLQYADYAVWQRDWLKGDVLERQVAFWKEHLAGAPAALDLPADRPRPPAQTFRGGYVPFAVDAETTARSKELGLRLGATPFMVLLSAFAALLSRYSGQRDLVVGTPIANRHPAEIEDLIGFFVNTLALRVGFEARATFEELVRATKETALSAFDHQDVPFERVVEALGVPRDMSRTPVFQVMFAMENVGGDAERRRIGDLETESFAPSDATVSTFDLTLFVVEAGSSLRGGLEYNSDLFDRATIARMAEHFVALLRGAIARPDEQVARLSLMSEAQRRQVLIEWNDTHVEYAEPRCLHELFEEQARRTPEAIAVEFDGYRLTYRELDERAERIASWLIARGAGREQRVAVSVPRSANMVAAVLGVLKAGAAYVPIDPRHPEDRKRFMRDDARCVAELTEATIADALAAPAADRRRERVRPEQLAYVLYTSGSTGRPKGVMVEHRNVVNLVRAMLRDPGMAPTDVELALTTLSFDVAGAEIYVPLAAGARIVVASEETARDPRLLSELIARAGANTAGATPATWRMLIADGWRPAPGMHIHCAGEALPRDLAESLLEGGAKLYNFYGPTETAIYATGIRIGADDAITIGRPIVNTTTYVLDRNMEPVAPGEVGELYIGGANVARGYYARPELTSEKFIPDPFSSEPGARMYATGDLARWRANGTLDYLGRSDHQVKVRGYRIELGEIEAALTSRPEVSAAVVVAREDTPGDKRLVGYIVATTDKRIDVAAVKTALGRSLPDYMVPSAFVVLAALPLTPSGKVDRKALPAPDLSAASEAYVAPQSPLEESLAEVWRQVLGVPRVGIHDDFFALGGHSLLATQVVSRIRSVLGLELPVRAVFEAPTVSGLAQRMCASPSDGANALPPLARVGRSTRLPASFAQTRLWFLDQLGGPSATYNLPRVVRMEGTVDASVLERAVQELVARHETLRTTFIGEEGEPYQLIHPEMRIALDRIDASSVEEAHAIVSRELHAPFDLANGPLLRTTLVRVRDDLHFFVLCIHHIATDGWSNEILMRELTAVYRAFSREEPSPLAAPAFDYADFAMWQRSWLVGDVLARQLAFWKDHLAGAPAALELPTDRPRPAVKESRGATVTFDLDAALTDAVRALCRREGFTPFMVLLTAFQCVLSRWSGQRDIVVGTPIANRTHEDLEGMVGFFVNTLALRARFDANTSFADVVHQTKLSALSAHSHQDLPFERLVEELGVARDMSRTPVFQAMFAMESMAMTRQLDTLDSLSLHPEGAGLEVAKFDLTLAIDDENEDKTLRGTLEYDLALFDRSTIARFAQHFVSLLRAATARPEEKVARLPLMSEAERRQVLVEWNDTRAEHGRRAVHESFEEQATRTPDALAVEDEIETLTYRELEERANQLAHELRSRQIGREDRVGTLLPRGVQLVVAQLAVMKAGAAFVALDPGHPPVRIAYTSVDAGAKLVLSTTEVSARIGVLPVETLALDHPDVAARLRGRSPDSAKTPVLPRQAAYVIYTSGTTGKPKGAVLEHAGMSNCVAARAREQQLGPDERATQIAGPAFDATVIEIWPPLTTGASLHFVPEEMKPVPDRLVAWLRAKRITRCFMPTALLEAALDEDVGTSMLRSVATGGEALRRRPPSGLRFEIVNLYGPTEATVYATGGVVETDSQGAPHIGRPIDNAEIYILDSRFEPVPIGVCGELCIGGAGVGRGYIGRPELTADKFVPDSFGQPGARLYRTGDLARWRRDGTLEYIGRIDNQIKLRGFRIELGEIEAALSAHPDVAAAAVVVRGDSDDKRLVGYVVPATGATRTVDAVKADLRRTLPEYMVPSAFVLLDAMPLTSNGKVDRAALPAADLSSAAAEYVAARDCTEEVLAGIFSEVLGVSRVGIHDDFFGLGGHSLLATKVVSRIGAKLDAEMGVRALFEAPTVAQLAERVRAMSGRAREKPPLVRVPDTLPLAMSFDQEVLAAWESRRSPSETWNGVARIDLKGPLDVGTLREAVAAIVTEHEVLRWACDAKTGLQVHLAAAIPFEVVDMSGATDLDIDGLCSTRARTPFAFDGSPLTRFLLVRRSETDHVLLLGWHAFVNALSRRRLIADRLMLHWRSIVERTPPPEPPPIRYRDFVAWQRAWYGGRGYEEILAAKKRLEGATPLEIADHPRSGPLSPAAIEDGAMLDAAESARVHDLSRAMKMPPFTIFVACAATLLSRWSGSDDIAFLTPVDLTPTNDAFEEVVGFFHNWNAIRISTSGHPSFAELLTRARDAVIEAHDSQAAPAALVFDTPHVFDHPVNRVLLNVPLFGGRGGPSTTVWHVGDVTATEGGVDGLRSGSRNELGIGMSIQNGAVGVLLRGAEQLFRRETIAARRAELCAVLRALTPDTPSSKLF